MWHKVSSLLGLERSEPSTERSVELATAALLVQVSVADQSFDESERQALARELKTHFNMADTDVQHLIRDAEVEQQDASCLYRFTRVIAAELDQDGRQAIVRLLWRIAVADNRIENFELNAIAKISGLLGVSPEDRVRIKHEVEAGG